MTSTGKPFTLEVIVDLVCDDAHLLLRLENTALAPARDVHVSFDQAIAAADGESSVNKLRLFNGLPFLAGRKRIDVYLGPVATYLRSGQPQRFDVSISYIDATGTRRSGSIAHDVSAYAGLGFRPGRNQSD